MKRQVVVTGMGLVSPLGCDVLTAWQRLIEGCSGIRPITGSGYFKDFDITTLPSRIAGQVLEGELSLDTWVPWKEQKRVDRFILLGIVAAAKAMEDARWSPKTLQEQERTGTYIGSGIGGLPEIELTALTLNKEGPRRVSPFFIPASLVNLISGNVSIQHHCLGPNLACVTACASGAHAIGEAAHIILRGDADVMIAGGAESAICPIGMAGFSSLKALSVRNDEPEKASRPFDQGRDGFVMAEGAGLLVLEEESHARARGAKIYARLLGYGATSDAHHVTSPCGDGAGAYRCMKAALNHAGLKPEDIGYINAHGTSTQTGDKAELTAVEKLFPNGVFMSSTKSSIGHSLGAAGSIEAIFCIMALIEKKLPPTLNLDCPENTFLDLIPNVYKEVERLDQVMSNSFGFGGTNASLIFGKPDADVLAPLPLA